MGEQGDVTEHADRGHQVNVCIAAPGAGQTRCGTPMVMMGRSSHESGDGRESFDAKNHKKYLSVRDKHFTSWALALAKVLDITKSELFHAAVVDHSGRKESGARDVNLLRAP